MAGLEGKTLDHYQLQKMIGRGGMADVYEGYDPNSYLRRTVAVKVFKREDDEMLRRFIREARLMARLSNEHLVPIYDSGETQVDGNTLYYIVMPFLEGGTLRARIRRSPLSLTEACQSLRDIASALDYIHKQGIIHRDIKSSNVLLNADGRCYLADFGIARVTTDATQLTTTGNVLGTVDYVAPELFEDNHKADNLTDLYSLGVLLFEMVTGRLPFNAESQLAVVTMHVNKPPPLPSSISQQIFPQVEQVMLKALAKKPEQRYKSATELAEAFCNAVNKKDEVQQRKPEPVSPSGIRGGPLILPPLPLPSRPVQEIPTAVAARNVASQSMATTQQVARRLGRARPERQRALVVGGLALVSVLILVSIGAIAIAKSKSTTHGGVPTTIGTTVGQTQTTGVTPGITPDLTATAQAIATMQAQATGTAQVQATGTAVARATATVVAQASATAGVVQTATAGTPVYQDPLNNATHAATAAAMWDQDDHCAFQSDGYHVTETVNLVNFHGCRESANSYSNAAITVDVRINSGYTGGLFFRVSTDTLNRYSGYLFEIDSAGNYRVSIDTNGTLQTLKDWTASSALKQGNTAANTLEVIAQNGTLLFYANGVFLASVNDTTYTSGTIGFLATTNGTNADIVYSNVKVYSLS